MRLLLSEPELFQKNWLAKQNQSVLEQLIAHSYRGMRNTFLPQKTRQIHSANKTRATVMIERKFG